MLGNWLSDPMSTLQSLLLVLPGLIIGISFHEFAHAWMADRLGDPTPRAQGRVTISPFAHIHPMGLLMIALVGFGFGRPVQINPNNFKKRRRDEILVSLAGVTMNLILAFLTAGIVLLLYTVLRFNNLIVGQIIYGIFDVNLTLMVFNLLPIPPLDGFQIVRNIFIGPKTINFFWWLQQYGTYILLAIFILPGLSSILRGVIGTLNAWGTAGILTFWNLFF